MSDALNDFAAYVNEARPGLVSSSIVAYNELTLNTTAESLIPLLTFLRDDVQAGYVNLIDIAGVDWPQRARRFDVVYHLLSPSQNARIRVKVQCGEDEAVPSACAVYPGADWFEREAWDLYGILFTGHPDLRRAFLRITVSKVTRFERTSRLRDLWKFAMMTVPSALSMSRCSFGRNSAILTS